MRRALQDAKLPVQFSQPTLPIPTVMPLPIILLPIALAGGSAAIQAASKVRAHRKLTQLHQELEEARQQHVQAMQRQYERQLELCAELNLPEPPLPDALLPWPEAEPVKSLRSRLLSRLPHRKKATLLDQRPGGSSATIVGRHGIGFAASTVWKTSSGQILRVVQPIGARAMTVMPKFAGLGSGATGSIAASTGLRFALSAFSIVGIAIGPALAAWTVWSEYQKVKKARVELADGLARFRGELNDMSDQTSRWESQLAGG